MKEMQDKGNSGFSADTKYRYFVPVEHLPAESTLHART